jgi:hypothetical protein
MAKRGKVKKIASKEKEERPIRIKKYKYLFLIVCEDQKTEPNYFEKFKSQIPEDTIFLKTVGTGRDPFGVVQSAIKERNILSVLAKKEVDKVWAVFDKDDADENKTKIENFNAAFEKADEENIEIAYSNEVFELWLLLHFVNVDKDKPLPRKTVYELLEKSIQKNKKYKSFIYDHKKPNPQTIEIIFEIGNLSQAIKRAETLLENQKKKSPIEANPSTKIHLLVQELQDWIKYYTD